MHWYEYTLSLVLEESQITCMGVDHWLTEMTPMNVLECLLLADKNNGDQYTLLLTVS